MIATFVLGKRSLTRSTRVDFPEPGFPTIPMRVLGAAPVNNSSI